MPANNPALTIQAADALTALGQAVHARRKALRISAVAAAEAAGISRVTLHRIEKGTASVTAGAYMAVFAALGLNAQVAPQEEPAASPAAGRKGWLPARVRIADYPKLKELAWQVHGTPELTPREALGIYERNWRHVDPAQLSPEEQDLVEALRQALGADAGV
ncbi:MAG: helix-turn-helix domain-containing protein [Burkholderiales bacterium]|nr:helix-turn-helix domain-containing protein [Burkholderiales bacterium]